MPIRTNNRALLENYRVISLTAIEDYPIVWKIEGVKYQHSVAPPFFTKRIYINLYVNKYYEITVIAIHNLGSEGSISYSYSPLLSCYGNRLDLC